MSRVITVQSVLLTTFTIFKFCNLTNFCLKIPIQSLTQNQIRNIFACNKVISAVILAKYVLKRIFNDNSTNRVC